MTLQQLVRGDSLSHSSAISFMQAILDGELPEPQIAAALAVFAVRKPTAEELCGFATTLRSRMIAVPDVPPGTIDTCGTGGSGGATLNTSTMTSIVAAAAGATVAKHGNRSASGRCGSLDVLEALGAKMELGAQHISALLRKHRFAFVNARNHHPGLGRLGPLRSTLGFRTIFNLLGPIVSPAQVRRQLVGVSDAKMAPVIAETLRLLEHQRSWVVAGPNNLDEIALCGQTQVWEITPSGVTTFILDPHDLGLNPGAGDVQAALRGGDISYNAQRFENILRGEDRSFAQDMVSLNAAAALLIAEIVPTLQDGITRAQSVIESGAAFQTFSAWREDTVTTAKAT